MLSGKKIAVLFVAFLLLGVSVVAINFDADAFGRLSAKKRDYKARMKMKPQIDMREKTKMEMQKKEGKLYTGSLPCHLYNPEEKVGLFTNRADYTVVPSPTLSFQYAKLSDAIDAAQIDGDRDSNGTIEICVQGGDRVKGSIVYVDEVQIPTDAWSGPPSVDANKPVRIFSSSGPTYTRFKKDSTHSYGDPMINMRPIASSDALGTLSTRDFTIEGIGFSGHGNILRVVDTTLNLDNVRFERVAKNPTLNLGHLPTSAVRSWRSVLNVRESDFVSNSVLSIGASSMYELNVVNSVFSRNLDTPVSYSGGFNPPSIIMNFLVDKSEFKNNYGLFGGALKFISYSGASAVITNSEFIDNEAGEEGGAIYISDGTSSSSLSLNETFLIEDIIFSGNSAGHDGGAVFCKESATVITIQEGEFISNEALENGGALASQCDTAINDSEFKQNTAGLNGGAIFQSEWYLNPSSGWIASSLDIFNTFVVANEASQGGGVSKEGGEIDLQQATVAGNHGFSGILFDRVDYSIDSSVVSMNEFEEITAIDSNSILLENSDLFDYSGDIASSATLAAFSNGIGNISEDPMFVGNSQTTNPFSWINISSFDFSLRSGSPAAGMGAN